MWVWGVGHVCAIAVGISLGLLGGGGSILAVPILVYVMGVGAKSAIAISLVSVGTVSAMGAFLHWQKGNVRFDIALLFAPTAMVGAYLGAFVASFPWISETFQLLCFGIIMLLASVLMIVKSRRQNQKICTVSTDPPVYKKSLHCLSFSRLSFSRSSFSRQSFLHQSMIPIEGLGIGMLTGFVGIGGGFAIVPALVLLTSIPMKQAVGTSLLIISLKSITGFFGYLGQLEVNWLLVISFTLAASVGTLLGSYLSKFTKAKTLQAGFGYFVLFFAILILFAQLSLP